MEARQFGMTHSAHVATKLETAFDLINDVSRWADIFPPCLGARVVEKNGQDVLIEVTATVGEGVRTWRSRRRVHPEEWKVEFFQTDPYPPMASMQGYWQVVPQQNGKCEVVLFHGFEVTEASAAAGEPKRSVDEAEAWIRAACDQNSKVELESFKSACE